MKDLQTQKSIFMKEMNEYKRELNDLNRIIKENEED